MSTSILWDCKWNPIKYYKLTHLRWFQVFTWAAAMFFGFACRDKPGREDKEKEEKAEKEDSF